ncbi:nop domain-containing protein [Lichtheimia corymbifera JMRC:FSU:9682]|uniref:Nop domain-containing protein n=1 Tax=Lichtheimia corymbifera JMRC:FSU:9682 TaxID=1263082 RepID=A0A068S1F6_9FUNG|nr:nop domain-containing protein [Lichtheimia corymbifera JMRC:FSU:9682]
MSSLADELAADLDFSDEQSVHSDDDRQNEQSQDQDAMDINEDGEATKDTDRSTNDASPSSGHQDNVHKVTKFLQSKQTKDILERIEHFKSRDRTATDLNNAPTEEDEEYQLIVNANSMTADIDGEIQAVHKFIRDHYAPRFPELESLILNPMDYARTVKAIGNEKDLTKVDLRSILPSATVMVVTVTATTSNGKELSPEEWKVTEEACDVAFELDNAKRTIINYVESRMTMIAPNLSNVVGSSTAAKLLTAAGGLSAFCKIPACNIEVLGNTKKTNTGFSRASMERNTGYIISSPLVLSVPADLRRKVTKIIAAKCALSARIDASQSSPSGEAGQKFRNDIDQKIEKLQEPPPTKVIKALPVPDEGPKKRRGGKRVRRQKEAYAMTELRAARNRMAFGEAEEEVEYGDETEGLGMTTKQVGKIRASIADPRNKVKAPKQQQRSLNTAGTTSGLASSLAFTPVQGIELVDPTAAAERVKKANEKYFGDGAFSIVRK